MLNFSGISRKSVLGQALRLPLNLIPSTAQMGILQGPMKGMQWIVGSSQHGCWLGSYEYEKQVFFQKTIRPGSVVFDIGAHVGFHTLLASTLVGPQGKVVAFEPMPENINYLKRHLQLNQIKNVSVMEAAVSDHDGTTRFEMHACRFQGRLASQGGLSVRVVSLDHLIATREIPSPDYLKIDVEGAEFGVLRGAKQLLLDKHPTIVLALHGEEVGRKCRQFLQDLGYHMETLNDRPLESSDEIFASCETNGKPIVKSNGKPSVNLRMNIRKA